MVVQQKAKQPLCVQLSNTSKYRIGQCHSHNLLHSVCVRGPSKLMLVPTLQVAECTSTTPEPKAMTWICGANNTLARWPNNTEGWPSAWDVQAGNPNATHVLPYYIPNGWITNLVTRYWPLGRTSINGSQIYAGEYWHQGAKRVAYQELTIEPGSYVVPGVPDGRSEAADAYFDEVTNERHYWSEQPTNTTTTYNTTFKVWGTFTTFVTHLSNSRATWECHTGNKSCGKPVDNSLHSGGRREEHNIMQCPFQFRCFSTESAAGSPACHRNFPQDYTRASDISDNETHPRE